MVRERGQMRRGMRCWWHEALCNWTCERGSRYDRRLEQQRKETRGEEEEDLEREQTRQGSVSRSKARQGKARQGQAGGLPICCTHCGRHGGMYSTAVFKWD